MTVEEKSSHYGFEGIRENGVLFGPSGLGFGPPEFKERPKAQMPCLLGTGHFVDELMEAPGQFALLPVGLSLVERVRHDQADDGIAEEFEPFIALQPRVFVRVGGVPESRLKNADIRKGMEKSAFQFAESSPAFDSGPLRTHRCSPAQSHPPPSTIWPRSSSSLSRS